MPIAKHLRPLYRTRQYLAARAQVILRAKNSCEECDKPNGERVRTKTGGGHMFWRPLRGSKLDSICWRNERGWRLDKDELELANELPARTIRVVCTVAHLDHTPGHDELSNLKLLCQWCHLHYDQSHHKLTRSLHKDQRRPLLAPAII